MGAVEVCFFLSSLFSRNLHEARRSKHDKVSQEGDCDEGENDGVGSTEKDGGGREENRGMNEGGETGRQSSQHVLGEGMEEGEEGGGEEDETGEQNEGGGDTGSTRMLGTASSSSSSSRSKPSPPLLLLHPMRTRNRGLLREIASDDSGGALGLSGSQTSIPSGEAEGGGKEDGGGAGECASSSCLTPETGGGEEEKDGGESHSSAVAGSQSLSSNPSGGRSCLKRAAPTRRSSRPVRKPRIHGDLSPVSSSSSSRGLSTSRKSLGGNNGAGEMEETDSPLVEAGSLYTASQSGAATPGLIHTTGAAAGLPVMHAGAGSSTLDGATLHHHSAGIAGSSHLLSSDTLSNHMTAIRVPGGGGYYYLHGGGAEGSGGVGSVTEGGERYLNDLRNDNIDHHVPVPGLGNMCSLSGPLTGTQRRFQGWTWGDGRACSDDVSSGAEDSEEEYERIQLLQSIHPLDGDEASLCGRQSQSRSSSSTVGTGATRSQKKSSSLTGGGENTSSSSVGGRAGCRTSVLYTILRYGGRSRSSAASTLPPSLGLGQDSQTSSSSDVGEMTGEETTAKDGHSPCTMQEKEGSGREDSNRVGGEGGDTKHVEEGKDKSNIEETREQQQESLDGGGREAMVEVKDAMADLLEPSNFVIDLPAFSVLKIRVEAASRWLELYRGLNLPLDLFCDTGKSKGGDEHKNTTASGSSSSSTPTPSSQLSEILSLAQQDQQFLVNELRQLQLEETGGTCRCYEEELEAAAWDDQEDDEEDEGEEAEKKEENATLVTTPATVEGMDFETGETTISQGKEEGRTVITSPHKEEDDRGSSSSSSTDLDARTREEARSDDIPPSRDSDRETSGDQSLSGFVDVAQLSQQESHGSAITASASSSSSSSSSDPSLTPFPGGGGRSVFLST